MTALYGKSGFDQLILALKKYRAAIEKKTSTALLVVDDAGSAALAQTASAVATDSTSAAHSVRVARDALRATSILLVGGPEILPHCVLENPARGKSGDDEDTEVPSDNPYGSIDADPGSFAVPVTPVGRLVGEHGGSVETLLTHIERMIEFHAGHATGLSGAYAFGCAVWDSFTREVATCMGPGARIRMSPAHTLKASTAAELRTRLLYFNLHGGRLTSTWEGAGSDPKDRHPAITPDSLALADLRGAVVVAANCYGAHVASRTITDSCALTAIRAGVRTFIGSSCFSYGSGSLSSSKPLFGDRLAQLFFLKLRGGMPAGMALVSARRQYVIENLIGNMLNPRERKTALQFLFLGDPLL